MSHQVTVMTRQGCSGCVKAEQEVILVDGDEHGYWRVEEDRLRKALADLP
jgi:hypothetical protein